MFPVLQPSLPLIDGPRDNTVKPTHPNQPAGHTLKILIGGVNVKLKNEKQNKTPGKLVEKSEKERDKPGDRSESGDDKTRLAVGHHKVPPVTPRFVAH